MTGGKEEGKLDESGTIGRTGMGIDLLLECWGVFFCAGEIVVVPLLFGVFGFLFGVVFFCFFCCLYWLFCRTEIGRLSALSSREIAFSRFRRVSP